MLNALFTGEGATSVSKNINPVKRFPNGFVAPAVSTLQQASIDAHVRRMRSIAASSPTEIPKSIPSTQSRSSSPKGWAVSSYFSTVADLVIDIGQPSTGVQSDRYRSLFGRPVDIVRSMLKDSSIQDTEPASSVIDTESAAETRSEDRNYDSGYQSDGSSEGPTKSTAISLLDTDCESIAHFLEIAEISAIRDAESDMLRARLDESEHQSYLRDLQLSDLQGKYNVQIAQRKADYANVTGAYDQLQDVQAYISQLEQEMEGIVQDNDREVSRLEHNHRAAMSAMEDVHQKELINQNDEIAKLQAELLARDEACAQVEAASRNAMETRVTALASELAQKDRRIQDLEAANTSKDDTVKQAELAKNEIQLKLREAVRAAEINCRTWANEKNTLSENAYRASLDYQDSLQKQKEEIVRLTRDNRVLELEKDALSMTAFQHQEEDFTCLRNTFNESEAMRKELAAKKREIIILNEKIENILESMQQERDHWGKNYEKEKVAQVKCRQLQIELSDAQEQIAHRDERIRDMEADLEAFLNSSLNVGDRLTTVQKSVLDNDELRARFDTLEQEKAAIQKAMDAKDNENFSVIFESQILEGELNKLKTSHDVLQQEYSVAEQEKYYLRAAIREGRGEIGWTQEEKLSLVTHLESLTDSNKKLTDDMKTVMEERNELLKSKESVETKAQNKTDQALKYCAYLEAAYWDHAVPKVDDLQRELDLKNGRAPGGGQPRPERNPRVADRFALRAAIDLQGGTVRGVDPSHITSVYNEPGFRPGLITAGMDALRVLRPIG